MQTPAQYVIEAFQGVRATARAIGRSPSSVSKWQIKGQIPRPAQKRILEVAQERGLDITPGDLILGR
jgi:hypothetical protein